MKGEVRKKHAMKQHDAEWKELDSKWDKIDKSIKDSDPTYVKPKLPFKSDALICDFNELYKKIYDKEKYINL